MTTFNDLPAACPSCGHHFTITYSPSICTWLNPELIQQIYDRGYKALCPECGHLIPLAGSILINAPMGMFMLDLGQELSLIREILENVHLMDENGKVRPDIDQTQLLRERMRKDEEEVRHKYQGTMDFFG